MNSNKLLSIRKTNRLKKRSEILQVLNTGSKRSGYNLSLFLKPSEANRFAILVSKKVGNAVKRNRIKRILREIYRLHPEWFEGYEVVFMVKRFKNNFNELENELKGLFNRK